ncbi:adenylate/guanylate cyclase domain-containing protein [Nocardioides nematodiphilus]|uniref:adenylate/guanylate cyclase domain-containing protein n=1 Tax=Nocardioides nematodiphilus TaxID=2849669 RepID=UPI001CD91E7F|nr:adenylate/guanylate cyclase domain-containing protein [Nocardioides nematodiphilus]MCA1983634.1 adenylate/guanylate cyclase domain-containing protein [Nocardioides nematodiphilus]
MSPLYPGNDPEAGTLTADEVADRAGVPFDQAKRLWRALGFPEVGGEAIFGSNDVEALRRLQGSLGGTLDLDLVVNLTRGLGQTMARLSDWEIAALVHQAETRQGEEGAAGGGVGALESATKVMVDFNETFEELMLYVWRRHMGAAVARLEAASSGELGTTQLSVGFADIVQFTALSNTLTEQKIGDLVELFESRCADVVAVNRGRIIKSLGDSVLFVNDDPIRAYDTAEGIINVIGRDARMPDVRVGLATGSVVARLGDVYGPPVNMAARLTAVARKNRIIIDEATAALLPDDQFETRRLPARPVRGFGIVEPLTVRRN